MKHKLHEMSRFFWLVTRMCDYLSLPLPGQNYYVSFPCVLIVQLAGIGWECVCVCVCVSCVCEKSYKVVRALFYTQHTRPRLVN